jgi:hypothetical protein
MTVPGHFYCREAALRIGVGEFLEEMAAALRVLKNKSGFYRLIPDFFMRVVP